MQKYDIIINYIPEKQLIIPELLSRLPAKTNTQIINEDEKILKVEHFLRQIELIDPINREDHDDKQITELQKTTKMDMTLQNVIREVCNGWTGSKQGDKEMNIYKSVKDELSVQFCHP